MPSFQLILRDAEPPTDEGREKLQAKLETALKLKPEAATRLFSRLPVVLKSNLSREEAERLAGRLTGLGARMEVKEMPAAQDSGFSFAESGSSTPESQTGTAKDAIPGPGSQGPDAADEQEPRPVDGPSPEMPGAVTSAVPSGMQSSGPGLEPPDTPPADAKISRMVIIGGAAAIVVVVGVYSLFSGGREQTAVPVHREVSSLLAKQKEILGKAEPEEAQKPPRLWSGTETAGPLTTQAEIRGEGEELTKVEIEITGQQIDKPTDAEIVAKVTKPWMESFTCDSFRPASPPLDKDEPSLGTVAPGQPVTLRGTGRAYLVDGEDHRRALAEIVLTLAFPEQPGGPLTGTWTIGAAPPSDPAKPVEVRREPDKSYVIAAQGPLRADPQEVLIPDYTRKSNIVLDGSLEKPGKKDKKKTKPKKPKPKKGTNPEDEVGRAEDE